MKRVRYAGGTFDTGDAIVDALARFAAANANAERAAEIEVPAVDVDGHRIMIGIVIGPSSQLFFEPVVSHDELEDDEFVRHLEALTTTLITRAGIDPSP